MYVSKSKSIATRSACISSSSILAPIFRYAFNASEMLEQVYLVCEWPNTHDGTMRAIPGLTAVERREEKKEGESATGSERA